MIALTRAPQFMAGQAKEVLKIFFPQPLRTKDHNKVQKNSNQTRHMVWTKTGTKSASPGHNPHNQGEDSHPYSDN